MSIEERMAQHEARLGAFNRRQYGAVHNFSCALSRTSGEGLARYIVDGRGSRGKAEPITQEEKTAQFEANIDAKVAEFCAKVDRLPTRRTYLFVFLGVVLINAMGAALIVWLYL